MRTATLELTPEQQFTLDHEPLNVVFPETPIGILWAGKGHDREALRLENCGRTRMRRCSNGHVDRRAKLCCGFRFMCANCAKRNAQERFDAWLPELKTLMREYASEQFTLFDLFFAIPRTKDAINSCLKDTSRSLVDAVGFTPIHWMVPIGFVGDHLKVRLLLFSSPQAPSGPNSPHRPPPWNEIWPTAKISLRGEPMYRLTHVFEHELLAPFSIKDPNDRIAQETIFKGVHRLRAVGVKTTSYLTVEDESEEVSDISVEELSTEKSVTKKHAHDRCQTCGERFVSETRDWVIVGEDPNRLAWRDLPAD